jgi:filamentous hemagglutinin family protein
MGAHASWLGWPPLVLAQITPDTTLGAESSVVTPDAIVGGDPADLIEGGALRGSNVFHSFIDFNVAESQRVYFANPNGIENIVSRVTGGNVSNIFGTLGVDGAANLFLLNPNGILFGPNAQLDVAGSFSASTGDRFSYLDGSEFSAVNPNDAPLVTVNITPGVQFGADAPDALILNQGNLVAGQDLTLQAGAVNSSGTLTANNGQVWVEAVAGDVSVQAIAAESATVVASNNVILEESRLVTAGDLLIQADKTVRVRDSADNPVQVWADGDLTLQGNQGIDILALNHPETPFQSTGNLSLVSDGAVSGMPTLPAAVASQF